MASCYYFQRDIKAKPEQLGIAESPPDCDRAGAEPQRVTETLLAVCGRGQFYSRQQFYSSGDSLQQERGQTTAGTTNGT